MTNQISYCLGRINVQSLSKPCDARTKCPSLIALDGGAVRLYCWLLGSVLSFFATDSIFPKQGYPQIFASQIFKAQIFKIS